MTVLDECLELSKCGRLTEAIDLAGQAILANPSDGPLWQITGLLRFRVGQVEAARHALESANSLVPLSTAARCALADCYAQTGLEDLAHDLYLALAQDDRASIDLLAYVASRLGNLGESEDALDVCWSIIRRDPAHHQALFGIAFYTRRLGHPALETLPMIAKAHQIAPEIPLYRISLARLLHTLGRTKEAYELLVEVDPSAFHCPGCLKRAIEIFRDQGDEGRAVAFEGLL